jgi:LPS-assembly protein
MNKSIFKNLCVWFSRWQNNKKSSSFLSLTTELARQLLLIEMKKPRAYVQIKKIILISTIFLFSQPLLANGILFNKLPNEQITYFLGWQQTEASAKNFCDGYFQEPKIIISNPIASPIDKSTTNIVAKKQVLYNPEGESTLEGDVTITQPGRQLIADKIILHRDSKTNKFNSANLYGHVQLFEFGKLIVGNQGFINFDTKVITIDNAIYRLAIPKASPNAENLTLWGRVKHVLRDESKTLTLFNSSYSTCQPNTEAWHINSSKLRLNKETGVGKIGNAVFNIKSIPILYFPYFEFPIDKRRKSGFLFPVPNFTNNSGFELDLPFYLNLAPNYDATITPHLMSKRGALFDTSFRYLTLTSNGRFNAQYIFNDQEFKAFKNSALTDYSNDPALGRLENSSNNRGLFAWQNNSRLNNYWTANIDVNYSGDDYFLHDFGVLPSVINEDQLLNQAMLNYADEHWRFLVRIQAFQTLHLVNQTSYDQYMRLPQLNLTGYFPNQKYGLAYQLNTEYVYFEHHRVDFYDKNKIYPIGNRFNFIPSIELPLSLGGAFFNPKLQVQSTFYGLNNVPIALEVPTAVNQNLSRITPIVNVDSGLLFKRYLTHFKGYTQTLEPRLFYLYVPEQNQNNIPVFDTNPSVISFDNLFRTNRFSSIDRIGDANQLSLALVSRILNADTGEEKLRASIGEIIALEKHRVCLDSLGNNTCDADPLATDIFSPIFGQLKYYLHSNWSLIGDTAWDINLNQLNSANARLEYNKDKVIFNVNYSYLINGDNYNNQIIDLNRIDLSAALPLQQHWQVMGGWNHYFSCNKEQTYFYGIEYNSCCWAIRFIGSHIYKGFDQFEDRFYLQFLLKGLGSVGNASPNSLLLNSIRGFEDNFS